jgi:hypothetical protein
MRNSKFLLPYTDELRDYIDEHVVNTSFAALMLRYRDAKRYRNARVYKSAYIDRRTYNKIIRKEYKPGRDTVISLGLSLELGLKEFDEFMAAAGYRLSNTSIRDIIVKFCVEKEIYDIMDVNAILFDEGYKLLTRGME